jgi:hypothetical protein
MARADDAAKKDAGKGAKTKQVTITKVDAAKDTLTVKLTDNDGKSQEKTIQLSDDAKIVDSNGHSAKLGDLQAGDSVCISREGDKVTEVRKHSQARITKMDPKAGTVTVEMKDDSGKQVTKTFHLVEDAEYADSTGRVAEMEIFKSGDYVLFIEGEGKIKAMKQDDKAGKNSASTANSDSKSTKKSSKK